MKRLVLLLILAVFGIFVYFATFRGMIIWVLAFPLFLLVGIYYLITAVITEKMVRKTRGNEEFLLVKASMPSKDRTTLIPGALVISKDDIVFYERKNATGGIKAIWSTTIAQIESYTLEKIDERHDGISILTKGDETPTQFATKTMKKEEPRFRKIIGWD